jgi:hypothetical protein
MNKFLFFIVFSLTTNSILSQEGITLVLPNDGDTILTKSPFFKWALLNEQQNDRTFYRFVLVELKEQQSPDAGVLLNQPLVLMDKIKGTQLFYPFDAKELKDGVWYAWQVQKISNNVIVDKSEVWKFILPLPPTNIEQYYKIKIKPDGSNYLAKNGQLKIELNDQYNTNDLKFYIYDETNNIVQVAIKSDLADNDKKEQIKRNGLNYYTLDLGEYALEGNYKLVIVDTNNQSFELFFTVK